MNRIPWRHILVGEFSIKRVLRSILLIYACVLAFAWFASDRLIFPGRRSGTAGGADMVTFTTADGVTLSALYLPNTQATWTVLYSHGNAEDLGDVRFILEEYRQRGFAVFAYDYRGYGSSEGRTTVEGTLRDADAAYGYVTNALRVPPSRVVVHGRSVGAALAIHLAATRPVAGLVVESGFVTAFRVMTRVAIAPFDRFRNIDLISDVHCPVLVMHGLADNTIPAWHGKELFAAAHEPKQFLWVPGAGHDDLAWVAGDAYWRSLTSFSEILQRPPEPH